MEIKVVRQILEWNEDCSNEIKELLKNKGIFMINVMGSPGAGKTSLIVEMIKRLSINYKVAVIEGDIAGQIDAKKIDALGIPVVQLNTDGACHIEAMSISHILQYFDLDKIDILLIENIGNLVCPAEFNIGEDIRIAILSIPEGDDKVEKYPLMFATSEALVINKYDMKEHFDFEDTKVESIAKDMNPKLEVFRISTRSQLGMDELITWVNKKIKGKHDGTLK
jgi:hydrogenase nickel incorporation protein HypB